MRGGLAVSLDPPRHQPGRRVENGRIESGEPVGPLACHAPQHGIDQAGIVGGIAVGPHQPHREIDGGVVGHIEKKDLRGPDEQSRLDARRLRRRTLFEKETDEMAQQAEPAQHGRDQRPCQRAIALRKCSKFGVRAGAVELLVERAMPPQHTLDDVGGDAPDGKARYVVAACRTGRRPARALHCKMPPCGQCTATPSHRRCQPSRHRQSPRRMTRRTINGLKSRRRRLRPSVRWRKPPRAGLSAIATRPIGPRKSRAAKAPNRPAMATGKSTA
jgi:hypothetical protein